MFACTKYGLRLHVEIPEEDYVDPFVNPSSYSPANVTLAMEKEKVRLSEFHKYEDGLIDQPFLTPETVEDD